MAKAKNTAFFCKECGFESSKWLGQCPGCRQWNTFVEEPIVKQSISGTAKSIIHRDAIPSRLSEIDIEEEERTTTGYAELDRVLGGGIVKGSLVLVGGDPGIGKSTLLLQVCRNISDTKNVLYISGEESLRQIKLRADRIGSFPDRLKLLCETNLDVIDDVIRKS
ncbi:MAG: ATPase domain-containing protein, partial [Lachnospiraceae bacterium]